MTTRTTHLDITGMSCANCSAAVEEALGDLNGVDTASANYATDEATVEYDPETGSLAAIYNAIDEAGYGAVSETVSIGITDMSCANCADSNAEALEALPGVIDADVNYATDEAQVRYNPAAADIDAFYTRSKTPATRPSANNAARMATTTTVTVPGMQPAPRRSTNSSDSPSLGPRCRLPFSCFSPTSSSSAARSSLNPSSACGSAGSSSCWQPRFNFSSGDRSTTTPTRPS
jgi:Copper chaperone